MKHSSRIDLQGQAYVGFPDHASLAALRTWYEGLSARVAVERHLSHRRAQAQSSRGILGRIRRRLIDIAELNGRDDLAAVFVDRSKDRTRQGMRIHRAIEALRGLHDREPRINDDIAFWLPQRANRVLKSQGITTLAELTLRVPRRHLWWTDIDGIGAALARDIEALFSRHPLLNESARRLVERFQPNNRVSWRQITSPRSRDGSRNKYRAPKARCLLNVTTDRQPIEAWLTMHETDATSRAYRKEAERLLLWANLERKRALSSLNTSDAIAYRTFLRSPEPREQWVGARRCRLSDGWSPFFSRLRPSSVNYALSMLSAMFRWFVAQQYVVANPFAGVTAGVVRSTGPMRIRLLQDDEWRFARQIADDLSTHHGWSVEAAQRLRFILDFELATGLRANELIQARVGDVVFGDAADIWLRLIGKGRRAARVAVPPLGMQALQTYLQQRGLPGDPRRCNRNLPLVPALGNSRSASVSGTRLRAVLKRFLRLVANQIRTTDSSVAHKLEHASPHWLRHTHATFALARGVELRNVRDDLRHASIATTSQYVHGAELLRMQQLGAAFGTNLWWFPRILFFDWTDARSASRLIDSLISKTNSSRSAGRTQKSARRRFPRGAPERSGRGGFGGHQSSPARSRDAVFEADARACR
ncbi:phage integrase family protein [Caballeronia novacaledonica]|uniref:Phage integrase family protein n=1 Tax=Caballeronia novacaledonica TaxID=1544861 RepID=A0A2U3I3C4_9BURK|nr:phage integrase family protein [Caballeronia novacaledonica]SPB14644.1 phage integrase family protein [Caballeronia novacaledonica]